MQETEIHDQVSMFLVERPDGSLDGQELEAVARTFKSSMASAFARP